MDGLGPAFLKTAIKRLQKSGHKMLLGVTGGIASGKTTVSKILVEMGAPAIDFDLLARQVVAPGTPALDRIAACFGKRVLRENGYLDRKKLAAIVFGDPGKRKKLEALTHPAIFEAFFKQVDEIGAAQPGAIVQGVMPLLIELRLQALFDKVLVVYIPPDLQIRRLTQRDGIGVEAARAILKAQLPIDAKLRHADFIIRNETSIEATHRQVEALWRQLEALNVHRT